MRIANVIRSYILRKNSWMFRGTPDRVDYHIKSGDYLPLIATMMGFMEEALRKNDTGSMTKEETEIAIKLAHDLRQDLRYVGANYRLVALDAKHKQTLRTGNVLTRKS